MVGSRAAEPVLLGSAMLGAVEAGAVPNLAGAMAAMSAAERVYGPAGGEVAALHAARFAAFKALQDTARTLTG